MAGYKNDLFILPFDHRGSFLKKMFEVEGREPTNEEVRKVEQAKAIIYKGFKKSLEAGLPRESAAILLDEQFGDELLQDAHDNGYTIILTVEKSGMKEFDFEYGDEYKDHIAKYNPTFVKALVQYNPEGEKELNARSREKLTELSKFAHDNGYKFLIEPLVPATMEQLTRIGGDPDKYDKELRPILTTQMMRELQNSGVEPDVWKIEGMESEVDYQMVVKQAQSDNRDDVGIVILGRAAEETVVEKWIKNGAKVPGVIGFAVGRTIFWDPISDFENEKISEDEAAEIISKRFMHFYQIFIETRQGL